MTETKASNRVISLHRGQAGDAEPKHSFPEPKGHEKILAGCKKNRVTMRIEFIDGDHATGQITQFDRWTVTLKDANDGRHTYFKHAIKSFGAIN